MPYLYLILSVCFNASANIFGKYYNIKNIRRENSAPLYNFILLASVFIGWGLLYAFDFSFETRVLPYSLLFALFYMVCNIGLINALKIGPAMLTALFNSLSLILTTIYGFFFWGAPVTAIIIVGLSCATVSMGLCLYTGKRGENKISFKWLIFVFLALIGNAGCAITQRTQQLNFDGNHGNMLMFFASMISLTVFSIMFFRSDKTDAIIILKRSWFLPVSAGICNVALNLFIILLATSAISPSLVYPSVGVGGLVIVILFSLFAFKEKLKWTQWIGVAIGGVATVLLSL